ncbi:MAG: PAS domain S-box protein [Deltaproteobacteria bacterium]|nr:PAS domain S-box protein [Deltaproteobacteria bacterium]
MNEPLKQKSLPPGENEFRLLVDSLQDYAVAVLDPEGRITAWNTGAAMIHGFQEEEIVGSYFQRLYTSEDQAKSLPQHALRQAAADGRYEEEGWRVRKDGVLFWANALITALRDRQGRLTGFGMVTRDLTLQKREKEASRRSEHELRHQARHFEEQLIASGESLAGIIASMAHEFNNPLGIVRGFTQDILSEIGPSDPRYRALQIIDEETRRCEKIIRDVSDYASPKGAAVCSVSVAHVIEKSLERVESHLEKQRVTAVMDLQPDLPEIYADPQQLEKMFVNLYLNAIDAMPEGGTLTVKAALESRDAPGLHRGQKQEPEEKSSSPAPLPLRGGEEKGEGVLITVTDTGAGIEPENLQKIFRPFFTLKKGKSLGLGLSICERIVKSHGGWIEVESRPGHGASFRIHLPLD